MLSARAQRRSLVRAFVLASYTVAACAFLSPLASSKSVPGEYDYLIHINLITQANKALQEGQFPIHVAPGWNFGYRYPIFQFYSPLPYAVAGFIYGQVTPDNPFLAYRFLIIIAMVVGAVSMCGLAHHLTNSLRSAYLAGMIYMTAPYFLVTIHARSAWTEALAQGVLPVVLFCTIRAYSTRKILYVLASSVSWCVLATTHLITFVYTAIFVALLMLLVSMPWGKNLGRMSCVGSSIVAGCALAWFHLGPVVSTPLRIVSFVDPYRFNWLSPIFTILSPVSIAPEPQPGRLSENSPGLHASMGWIVLIGAAYVLYAAAIRTEEWATVDRRYPRALLTIFGLSLFAAWSPVDFWYYLPSSLYITQFPYRMMEHVMWSGALLCAYALAFLFGRRQISDLALLMALLIVAASHGTWLNITNLPPRAVDTIATESVSHLAYIYRVDSAHPARLADVRVDEVKPNCKQDGVVTRCTVTSRGGDHRVVQLPAFYYPNLLAIKVNGSQVDYFPVLLREPDYVLAGVEIGPGESRIEIRFTGSRWANWVSATALAGVVLVAAFVGLRAGRRWSGRRSEHGAQRPS